MLILAAKEFGVIRGCLIDASPSLPGI